MRLWWCTQAADWSCRQHSSSTSAHKLSASRRDVAASHSQTAVAAAGTLRRHILKLLLRQQGRCGVTFSNCCCGSRDVAASHLQTAVAAAGQRLGSTVVPAQRHRQWCVRRDCDHGAGNRSDGGNSCGDGSAGSRRCSTISLTADWDAAG